MASLGDFYGSREPRMALERSTSKLGKSAEVKGLSTFYSRLHRQDFRVLLHPVATGDYGPSSGAPDIFSSLLRRLAQPGYAIPLLFESI